MSAWVIFFWSLVTDKSSLQIHVGVIVILFYCIAGVKLFIDSKAQLTLLGTEMDYLEETLTSEFVFNNPNIKGTCGCGESFNV